MAFEVYRNFLYTEFIMTDGSGKPRYEKMETRRVRIHTQINMATPGENMFTALVLLTENDIPGASLHGRKPAEIKKPNFCFGCDVGVIIVKECR